MDDWPRNKKTLLAANGTAQLFPAVGWPRPPFLGPANPQMSEVRSIGARESYQRGLQSRLDAWQVDVNTARVNAGKAPASARPGSDPQVAPPDRIVELQTALNAAKAQLKALRRTEHDQWESHQESIEKTWDELGDAMNSGNVRLN